MNMIKFGFSRNALLLILILSVCMGCSSKGASLRPGQANFFENQVKLTFKPDDGKATLSRDDLNKLFTSARLTGLELGYELYQINESQSRLQFLKKDRASDSSIIVHVDVTSVENDQKAFVFIKVSSLSESVANQAANEFKERYKYKLAD
jgi:hypothetical protein